MSISSILGGFRSNFFIFLEPGKKSGFFEKNFSYFFTSDFSFPKSFPTQPKTDFSPKNRPEKTIFLSLVTPTKLPLKVIMSVVKVRPVTKPKKLSIHGSGIEPRLNRIRTIWKRSPVGGLIGWTGRSGPVFKTFNIYHEEKMEVGTPSSHGVPKARDGEQQKNQILKSN